MRVCYFIFTTEAAKLLNMSLVCCSLSELGKFFFHVKSGVLPPSTFLFSVCVKVLEYESGLADLCPFMANCGVFTYVNRYS